MPSLLHRLVALYVRGFVRAGDPGDLTTFRERFLAANERTPVSAAGFATTPLSTPELTVLEHVPDGAGPGTLVHLHGGAYVHQADPRQFAFLRRLAAALGVRVVVPLYPLAPEHTWRDSRDALVELVGSLPDVVLTGDSAGGGYALSVAQGVRDAGLPQPRRMALISPWVDLRTDVPGRAEAAASDPWLRLDYLEIYAAWWAGSEADRARPEVSPAAGALAGLPPTLALCGTRDLLFPENAALARAATAAGWDYALTVAPGLIHVYPLLPVREARAAFEEITEFLKG